MTIAETIKEFLQIEAKNRFGNINQLAKKANINQAGLHRLLNEDDKPNLTTETIERLAFAFEFPDSIAFLNHAKDHLIQKKTLKNNGVSLMMNAQA